MAYGYDYMPTSTCENCPYNMTYGQYSTEPYMAGMYQPGTGMESSGEPENENKDGLENMYRQPPFFPGSFFPGSFFPRPFFPRPFFPGPFFPRPFFPRPFFPRPFFPGPFFFPPFPFFF